MIEETKGVKIDQPSDGCDHKWKEIGNWDGYRNENNEKVKIGGPTAECVLCGEEVNFTWGKWKELPDDCKVGLGGD
jgi:hypothetical protein